MEIFNRILGIDKLKQESDLRKADMRKFWPGFTEFRRIHSGFEPKAAAKISDSYFDLMGRRLNPFEIMKATEALMLAAYGTELTRKLYPSVTKKREAPSFVITNNKSTFSHVHRFGLFNRISDTWISVGVMSLVVPENWYSSHLRPWRKNEQMTVSKYLYDWAIIEKVLTGCEEYAHELYIRSKSPKYIKENRQRDEEIQKSVEEKRTIGHDYVSDLIYHTKDVEFRGLLWQGKLINTHFPAWSGPTNEFIKKVVELRKQSK